jgi:hypothetical protein
MNLKVWFIQGLGRRSPDQVLVALAVILFVAVVGYDLHRVATRLYAPTGFLMRLDAIATQANAAALNVKAITKDGAAIASDVKEGVTAWKQTSDTQRVFFQESLPKITNGIQGNLDSMKDLQDHHLAPAVDEVNRSTTALTAAADRALGNVGDLAGDVSETLTYHVDPLLDSGKTNLDQFLKLQQSPDLARAISGGAEFAGNLGRISGDLYVYSHPILNPAPCTTAGCRTKRVLTTAAWWLGTGADAAQLSRAFAPLKVRVVP